jgi:hypothetical protein
MTKQPPAILFGRNCFSKFFLQDFVMESLKFQHFFMKIQFYTKQFIVNFYHFLQHKNAEILNPEISIDYKVICQV